MTKQDSRGATVNFDARRDSSAAESTHVPPEPPFMILKLSIASTAEMCAFHYLQVRQEQMCDLIRFRIP